VVSGEAGRDFERDAIRGNHPPPFASSEVEKALRCVSTSLDTNGSTNPILIQSADRPEPAEGSYSCGAKGKNGPSTR